MDNYFKRVSDKGDSSKYCRVDFSEFKLEPDPGKRRKISDNHPSDRDDVRRAYLNKGPTQPWHHNFAHRHIGGKARRFNSDQFTEFGSWLEYSEEEEAAFCLYCFLFKLVVGQQGGGDSFVTTGFRGWNKKDRLYTHVGDVNSSHNRAVKMGEALMNQRQAIVTVFNRQYEQSKKDYRIRLTASLDCIRFLLRQGMAFRGHDESKSSRNRGNFLELLRFHATHNAMVNDVALNNAPKNLQLTCPQVQKEIVRAAASETTKAIMAELGGGAIMAELGGGLFCILVVESRNVSYKEQMALVIRFVRKDGSVVERFVGIVHVTDTTALALKTTICSLLAEHNLCLSMVRGQGYDRASNMRGELNGLKSLILRENSCAYYVHCFANQLQLTLVAVAKNQIDVAWAFNFVTSTQNVVGASCKRQDMLREKRAAEIKEALDDGVLENGSGLNQEVSLRRPGETRWGSHFESISNSIILFSCIIDVLAIVEKEASKPEKRGEAKLLLDSLQTFDFIFVSHLMQQVLGVTNELSNALQRKDQDIANAMALVKLAKLQLQTMRDEGWESLLSVVSLFCNDHGIAIPNMDDKFVYRRPRCKSQQITNLHRYKVEIFYTVVDMQLQELNDRFDEVSSELLLCVACLDPRESFYTFDKEMLLKLASFYPSEFSNVNPLALGYQLETYVLDVRSDDRFLHLKDLNDLSKKLVDTQKSITYPNVYMLLKLALLLPVTTATVERAFSTMMYIKTKLRNKMGDEWMNDCLITYIEKDMFDEISNEPILQHYQRMRTRKEELLALDKM